MATIKLYEQNPYLRQMVSRVVRCEPYKGQYASVLESTVFYPEGGGQPSDTGTLAGKPVSYVFIRDNEVYHVTDQPLTPGTEAIGRIDWERRFDFMQQHTGEHITTGQAYRLFGANNVGFHLSENSVMLDVDKELDEKAICTIEAAANRAIYENAPVEAGVPSREQLEKMDFRSKMERVHGPVRIVTVDGYDRCACCGTHVSSAGQIGIIKILDFQKHRGGTRILMAAGQRALKDYDAHQRQIKHISALLSAKIPEAAAAVERLLAENEHLKGQIGSLKTALIEEKLQSVPVTEDLAFYTEPGLSPDTLRRMALALMKRTGGICAVFSPDQSGCKYAVGSSTQDVKAYGREFNGALNGRGGGSKELIQGTVSATVDEIREYLERTAKGDRA